MEGGGSNSKEGGVPLLCTRLYCVFLFRSAACLVSELRQNTRDFWIWEYLGAPNGASSALAWSKRDSCVLDPDLKESRAEWHLRCAGMSRSWAGHMRQK